MFTIPKLLYINEVANRIGNFFKLPIQLFTGYFLSRTRVTKFKSCKL